MDFMDILYEADRYSISGDKLEIEGKGKATLVWVE
jgi:hypothetical protein